MKIRKSIIACIGLNRELGKSNNLLWHIPEDLAYFKKTTQGTPVIMGRSTFLSLPEKFRPLPGRKNIVLSRQKNNELKKYSQQIIIVDNFTRAFSEAERVARKNNQREIFVIGGASIYQQTLEMVDRLYLTIVKERDSTADVYFPEYKNIFNKEVFREKQFNEKYDFDFVILDKSN
jgi:dihydrofolate reductase